ncbi:TetR/AcrR family transcriptional regulator [Streptomyces flavidovirens]|uniref:TetR/AcrR family transcriptional regulator n=1 Tax=Streptomyces flavidovirens TaxID=67298 RepID=UPI0004033235|nr:TetR/AcrR family transcriptional regulator [Streptomyces flavidovirens]
MLRTAAELFQRQGYHGTGLNQVLADSRAPKGSLYFHFPGGKEELAAEAVTLSGRELGEVFAGLMEAAPDARTALATVGEHFARSLEDSAFQKGCPVATVALEAAAESEPIRAACDAVYAAWQSVFATALRGWGVREERADSFADTVLSSLQGAVLLARIRRDVSVIHRTARDLGDLIDGRSPSPV